MTSTDARFQPVPSLALTEQSRWLSMERCQGRVGSVAPRVVSDLRVALRYLLGI